MKKKKFTGKQIKFTINMISLAIFVFSYFYLYESYVKKTETAYEKVELVKAEMKSREQKLSEEASVRDKIAEVNAQKQEIIDSFPVGIKDEDNYMFIEQMEKALNIKTSSISTTESSLFYKTILPAQGTTPTDQTNNTTEQTGNTTEQPSNTADQPANSTEQPTNIAEQSTNATGQAANTTDATQAAGGNTDAVQTDTMAATVNTVSLSFMTDSKGLKEIAEYISNYPDHTIIDSVAVNADSATGTLAGNLVLKRFALTGTGKEYVEPAINGIDIGNDNIFGTEN